MCEITNDLISEFKCWVPPPPRVLSTSARSIHLSWRESEPPFARMHALLCRVCVKDKLHAWRQVYCGGKTEHVVDDLPPSSPHTFTIQLILRDQHKRKICNGLGDDVRWLESACSEAVTTSTDSGGSSVACFCLAVKGGYITQVQAALEERPALVNIVNATTGLTPLATAVKKGDLDMVKLLLSHGADMEHCGGDRRRPLHIAFAHDQYHIASYLMDSGADIQARDINGLRAEHMCARSAECVRELKQRGGDFTVTDYSGMSPLYHAVLVGASYEVLQLLVQCGCDTRLRNRRGLDLMDAAGIARAGDVRLRRVLQKERGDTNLATHTFTRITNIIARLQTVTRAAPFTNNQTN